MMLWRKTGRAFGMEAVREVCIRDEATMKMVAPMTMNLQKQRGVNSSVFEGMMWHYPSAQAQSSLSSKITLRLPVCRSETLRSKYSLFGSEQYIRLGRVLEDLDALAADVAYKHTGPSPIVVTACMDRMRLFSQLKIDNELQLEGAVVQVGRSSMVVSMSVNEVSHDGTLFHLASATFLMVSRTRGQDVAQPVPKLSSHSDGSQRRPQSVKHDPSSLWSGEEISLIRQLHSERQSNPDMFICHRNARDDKIVLMHSQNRNVHGRMFGGHLMASAYELAWLAAYKLAKRQPTPKFIDNVEFIRPVEIGSIVSFEAQVVFTRGKDAVVDVDARVINPLTGETNITNTFHFGFDLGNHSRQVVPETYDDMLEFVDGMRRYRSFQTQ